MFKNLFKFNTRENVLKFVCVCSVFLFVLTIIASIVIHAIDENTVLILFDKKLFSDFAEDLSYCIVDNPYKNEYNIHSIYPPFAYLIFYPFALICSGSLEQLVKGEISLMDMKNSPSFVCSYILYYLINIAIILLIVKKMSGFKGKELIYLLVTVFCFGPLIYCFGRGNVLITALLFALLFFYMYDSEKRWVRELANLCLACSVAIKIYPIILLFFFFKERRFLDFVKTLVYSLILLFIPFLLTKGGFNNIKEIWNNFTHFNGGEGRNLDFSNISLDSTISKFVYLLEIITKSDLKALQGVLSKLGRFSLLIVAIVLPLLRKNSKLVMQFMILSICTYELFQGVAYGYTMLILVAPIVIYFKNFDSFSKEDKLFYGICFAIIAMQPFYAFKNYIVQAITLIVLVVKAIKDIVKDKNTVKEENLNLEN